MSAQAIETLYRACNIVDNVTSSYQIYCDPNLSTWKKVCRIVPRLFGFVADSTLLASPVCPQIKSADLENLKTVSLAAKVTSSVSDIALSKKKISLRDVSNILVNVALVVDQTGSASKNLLCPAAETCSLLVSFQEVIAKRKFIKKVVLTFVKNLNIPNYEKQLQETITQLVNHMKDTKERDWLNYMQNVVEDCEEILNNSPAIEFRRIPYVFLSQPALQKKRCAINNQPIRKAVVIKETKTSPPIYYENNNLSHWYLNKKKKELPPRWPKSISFETTPIVADQATTDQITKKLQMVLDSVQNDPTEQERIRLNLIATQTLLESTNK